jgi:hypothetical protein
VFVRDGAGQWSQQAYVKASNPDADDHFGSCLALNGDGAHIVDRDHVGVRQLGERLGFAQQAGTALVPGGAG